MDTVHQGDWDGVKGVYHINAVDTVTQWQAVGCAPRINVENLKPVLEATLHQFPFPILGFHVDNGSEYINYTIAEMMGAMMVEFTKSRACRSQDNALVEGKNGAIIRKLIGYGHIPAEHAETLHKFYTAQLNPYLNFHRPCGFATVSVDARGKRKRRYKLEDYATPHRKLKSLPGGCGLSQAGNHHRSAGSEGGGDERHGFCEEDGRGKGEGITNLQDRVALSATNSGAGIGTEERGGNGGGVETGENQVQVSSRFHTPWESGKRRRIPTFPPRRRRLSSTKQKIKKTKGSRPLRGLQIRIYFRITLHWKRYRVSGSSEDWKMLLEGFGPELSGDSW